VKLRNEFTVPADVERAWDVLLDLERVAPCLPGARLEGGDGQEFTGQMTIKIGPVTSRYQGTVRIEQADVEARRAVMLAQARDAGGAGTAAATITTAMRSVDAGTLVSVETDIQISGPAAQFGRGVMQEVSSKLMARFADCLAAEMGAGEAELEAATDEGAEGAEGAAWAMGANEATPADRASGAGAGNGATPPVVDWTDAALARAPTRVGGYEETPVGRLPTGPAGDAALAAVRARPAAPRARPPRPAEDVLDLGELSRGAVLKRVVPVVVVIAAAVGALVALRVRRRRAR
jgi:carbon monoxide dehydrogenase subunit G